MPSMLIIGIIFLILGGGAMIWFLILSKNQIEKNTEIEKENSILILQNDELKKKQEELSKQVQISTEEAQEAMIKTNRLVGMTTEQFEMALEKYADALESNYNEKEKEYDASIKLMSEAYDNEQERMLKTVAAAASSARDSIAKITEELRQLSASKEAAMEAARREEEIKKQKEFYSLQISELDLNDIRMLEKIKPSLNKPRVLSMLIWTTWFRTPMTTLCNNVLGTKTVTGIYKITNQLNGKCYVGQAVDVADRWKTHAKCGLDIDTPAGNKLYAAMKEDGIWNFTWELLEACSSQELNEKEKFYIDLYDSKNYGYNSTIGNK